MVETTKGLNEFLKLIVIGNFYATYPPSQFLSKGPREWAMSGKANSGINLTDLINGLKELVPSELNELIRLVNMPANLRPGENSSPQDRINALIEWADSRTGPGLNQIHKELKKFKYQSPDIPYFQHYLESVTQRLKRLGFLSIQDNVRTTHLTFNRVVRNQDFEWTAVVNMRGDAFVIFAGFDSISLKELQEFTHQCARYAKQQSDLGVIGRSLFNFRVPTNLCLAVAIVDGLDEQTRQQIQTLNPFDHSVDLLWYEIPIIYESRYHRLVFYQQPQDFFQQFKGEIVWKALRAFIEDILDPAEESNRSN